MNFCRRNSIVPEVIEVVDSEDEQLMTAFTQDTVSPSRNYTQAPQLYELLKEFQKKVNEDGKQEIVISRKNVLESTFRALRRKFDPTCRLYVKFSGEMGLDHGGPSREFFRLVLQELSNSSLFEGTDGCKYFTHDLQKLEQMSYFMAGKMTAMSILHDGPGLCFLEENLARLMLDMETNMKDFNVDLLIDPELKEILKQLKAADDFAKRDKFLSQHGDWLISHGYTSAWNIQLEDRDKILEVLVKHFVFYRTTAESCQFERGMDEVCGLFSMMNANADVCLPILSRKPAPLEKEQFMELFTTNWTERGSNKRNQEEDTIY